MGFVADILRWLERPGGGAIRVAQPPGRVRVAAAHGIRRQPAMGRVWPRQVVVEPPSPDDGAGLGQAGEDLFIQTLVAELAVDGVDGPRSRSPLA